jgi:predicted nucleic acid-binding protein
MIASGRWLEHEAATALEVAESVMKSTISVIAEREFAARMDEARLRVPQDADDASTVGLALALECGVWTQDRDFFGCGLPVWSTDVLRRYLDYSPPGQ